MKKLLLASLAAVCLISLVLASVGAWFYLRHGVARKGVQ